MQVLITGAAGFIGFHLAKRLIARGDRVVGLDILNDYYDVNLKTDRLRELGIKIEYIDKGVNVASSVYETFSFIKEDMLNKDAIDKLLASKKFDVVINLAAQAGVRYSLTNPQAYIDSNIVGFMNMLEGCRHHKIKNFVYASSSSVYGMNSVIPFSTQQAVDHPISLYAASKKSNELMAHVYSHLYGIRTTGLRFFTVYGPWGRPDMASFLFTKSILERKPIDVFNNGAMMRDFTYVDDIINGVVAVIDNPASPNEAWDGNQPDPASSPAPYKLYNIGNSKPVKLLDFIRTIEDKVGIKANINMLPMQPGDVVSTYADISELVEAFNYQPQVDIKEGVGFFVDWYQSYYKTE